MSASPLSFEVARASLYAACAPPHSFPLKCPKLKCSNRKAKFALHYAKLVSIYVVTEPNTKRKLRKATCPGFPVAQLDPKEHHWTSSAVIAAGSNIKMSCHIPRQSCCNILTCFGHPVCAMSRPSGVSAGAVAEGQCNFTHEQRRRNMWAKSLSCWSWMTHWIMG